MPWVTVKVLPCATGVGAGSSGAPARSASIVSVFSVSQALPLLKRYTASKTSAQSNAVRHTQVKMCSTGEGMWRSISASSTPWTQQMINIIRSARTVRTQIMRRVMRAISLVSVTQGGDVRYEDIDEDEVKDPRRPEDLVALVAICLIIGEAREQCHRVDG